MTTAAQPRRVVCVCVENSSRSQMAEAFARLYGAGRVEAYFLPASGRQAVSTR